MRRAWLGIFAQLAGPTEHQRVAQTDLAADVQYIAVTLRQRQVPPCGLPGFHQLIGIYHESFAVGREAGTGAVAHEQGTAQLAFEFLYPCGDRGWVTWSFGRCGRLPWRTISKGAGEIDVHGMADGGSARIVKYCSPADRHHFSSAQGSSSGLGFRTQNTNSQTLPRTHGSH
jgi:hypothetical protein